MQNKFNEVANKITTIKTGFADAITAKGVETLPSSSFGDMIANIGKISGGGVTDKPEEPAKEWVKPHDWIDIEAEPLEPNEIRVLFSDVFNNNQGFYFTQKDSSESIKCSIDWGDGSPIEEINSKNDLGVTHKYIKGAGTPCDRGYTTFLVKIKNLYNVDLFHMHSLDGVNDMYSGILWFYGDLGTITDLEECFAKDYLQYSIKVPLLERVNITKTNECGYFDNCFKDAISLVSVKLPFENSAKSCEGMYDGCCSLVSVPLIDTSKCRNFKNMFSYCYSLKQVPTLDVSSAVNFESMLANCMSITEISFKGTPRRRLSNIFNGCFSLKKTPPIDTSGAEDTMLNNNHFIGCRSLIEIGEVKLSSNFQMDTGSLLMSSPIVKIDFSYDTETPPVFKQTVPIRINYSQLDKDALNKLMTQLPDGNNKTLDIQNNPGTQTCDTSIATSKNWTVLI